MASLAVLILTYNEELHIARALKSVAPFASEVFVIDCFSTDGTVGIARSLGATVLSNPWINYSRQFQWGLDNAPITADWIMRLDADEVIEPELAVEIADKLPTLAADVAGVNLKRKHIFLGRWIRHGGRYPLILTRIWRRGQGHVEDRWMDEHIVVKGRTVLFDAPFSDHNLNDLSFFTGKHNAYATLEAVDVLGRRHGLFLKQPAGSQAVSSRQASIKRRIKEQIYNQLPFQVAALCYFLFRYVGQLGFLDGREGLIYHVLQGYWYRFLVGAKVIEFDRSLHALTTLEERRAALARLTGLPL
ncbi:glycosyltransferase involved in cell wall biosynthesis [Neorhizobium galegae]|uniref:glycosyltransferase family 2 protein n=1 Tax=Neorhizobium galegae TaxID=399 RepID=UPI002784D2F7|nr:glycosyltransferase family 2 protein [Neorhizobium galegae]MDQ0133632.1 glycosyltransferase involved in cell wall biosynthesis [Neorhizobium galegae]